MEASEYLNTIHDVFKTGHSRQLMFQYIDDEPMDGKHVTIDGTNLLSFGSCCYLGLENDPRLKEGVIKAVERYGTQFSSSRGYLSVGPYAQFEETLSELFGGPALSVPTTTLGHMATIPVLVNEKDAIILDHQVHASIQIAATQARAAGAHVEVVRHGDLAKLEERVDFLCRTRRHVWHMIDGVFSMFGDLPDVGFLTSLMDRYEQLHLYVDDAHGMSVDGKHGRGIHLARMPHHPRMVFSTSLNKAFAAGGGCFVFPTDEMRQLVRLCGAPLTFGGPLQPPMIGAGMASAAIHLSPEIEILKADLREKIEYLNDLLEARGLPLLQRNHSPIFFLKTGPLRLAWNIATRMKDKHGLYLTVSAYPTVPMKRSGMRISITRHHSKEDLVRLADALALEWPQALAEEGLTREEIDLLFVNEFESPFHRQVKELFAAQGKSTGVRRPQGAIKPREGLELQHANTIEALDRAEWDRLLGGRGCFDSRALAMLENTFRDRPEPENNWKFHYFMVRDAGRPVLATFFTEALSKDDMLMRPEVSDVVEAHRKNDPYFLTSKALSMGSMLSEGNHLYLDREGPWREALAWVLDEAGQIVVREELSVLVLRDLPGDDPEMDDFVLDLGLVKAPMLPAYDVDLSEWEDDAGFMARLGKKTRKAFREEVLEREPLWNVRVLGAGQEEATPEELAHLHGLYMNVKSRKSRLNVFDLPDTVLASMAKTPGWEIISMHLPAEHGGPEDGKAVVFVAGFATPDTYTALVCGIDYDYRAAGPYRQMLWQALRRARAHGCKRLALGVDADFEKQRLRATSHLQCVYLQATDHFGGAVMRQIVEGAALSPAA